MSTLHRQPGRGRRAGRGFTLVEVLVALFIMAVLSGLAWQGIDGMLRAREASQAALERSARLATVLAQWDQDMARLSVQPTVQPLQCVDGQLLRLTREADGGVRVVVWALREGTLTRWAGPVARDADALRESWLASQGLLGNEDGTLRLLEEVADFRVRYFDGVNLSNCASQRQGLPGGGAGGGAQGGAAPAAVAVDVPEAVRLQLALPQGNLVRDLLVAATAP